MSTQQLVLCYVPLLSTLPLVGIALGFALGRVNDHVFDWFVGREF